MNTSTLLLCVQGVLDKEQDTWQESSCEHSHAYMKASVFAFKCWKEFTADSWGGIPSGLYLSQVVLTLKAGKFIGNLILGSLHVQNLPSNAMGQRASEESVCRKRQSLCPAPGMDRLPNSALHGLPKELWCNADSLKTELERVSFAVTDMFCYIFPSLDNSCGSIFMLWKSTEKYWSLLQLKQLKSKCLSIWGWSHC